VRVYANGWSHASNFRDACTAIATSQIKVQSGWAELPDGPGLDIDIESSGADVRTRSPAARD
jgi:hypothetical protein